MDEILPRGVSTVLNCQGRIGKSIQGVIYRSVHTPKNPLNVLSVSGTNCFHISRIDSNDITKLFVNVVFVLLLIRS